MVIIGLQTIDTKQAVTRLDKQVLLHKIGTSWCLDTTKSCLLDI
jgi:hypothetical protein